jgi:hypothetical protein
VQQIAFRLMVVGLAEELPMLATPANAIPCELEPLSVTPDVHSRPNVAETTNVSQSFLQNLVGFLRGKA